MSDSPPTLEAVIVRIDGLEKLYETNAAAQKEALKLQAAEYERRLFDLNGEAKRIAKVQAEHVSRELFDHVTEGLKERVIALEHYRVGIEGRIWGISVAVGVFVTVLNLALRFLK